MVRKPPIGTPGVQFRFFAAEFLPLMVGVRYRRHDRPATTTERRRIVSEPDPVIDSRWRRFEHPHVESVGDTAARLASRRPCRDWKRAGAHEASLPRIACVWARFDVRWVAAARGWEAHRTTRWGGGETGAVEGEPTERPRTRPHGTAKQSLTKLPTTNAHGERDAAPTTESAPGRPSAMRVAHGCRRRGLAASSVRTGRVSHRSKPWLATPHR